MLEEKESQIKVLAIHSYAVHGMASMKVLQTLLGSTLLPVPSLLLSGLTNIPGIVKTEIEFERLLKSTFEISKQRKQRLILYIGYLGSPRQSEIILSLLEQFKDIIDHILVDPVSGDHGRIYVPDSILAVWPRLLRLSDWAFPNYTELKLFAGFSLAAEEKVEVYIQELRKRFPSTNFIVTGIPLNEEMLIHLSMKTYTWEYRHEKLNAIFGGTGDVFAGLFVKYYLLCNESLEESITQAAHHTLNFIRQTQEKKKAELIINPSLDL